VPALVAFAILWFSAFARGRVASAVGTWFGGNGIRLG